MNQRETRSQSGVRRRNLLLAKSDRKKWIVEFEATNEVRNYACTVSLPPNILSYVYLLSCCKLDEKINTSLMHVGKYGAGARGQLA